jgi:hypothetical protein
VAAFEGTLEAVRRGGTMVSLPADVLEELGGGSRFRVRGRLNGIEFASSTMPMGGGRVCLGVHKVTREAAGVGPGAVVTVELERDERERVVDVPPELEAALRRDQAVREAFERLAYTHRKEYASWIAGAKRPETRERRLAKAIAMLRAGVRHP